MSAVIRPKLGAAQWLRANLFSTPGNTVLTLLVVAALAWLLLAPELVASG